MTAFVLAFLVLPDVASACARCFHITVTFPDNSTMDDNICLFELPVGAQWCFVYGGVCGEIFPDQCFGSVLREADEPAAVAGFELVSGFCEPLPLAAPSRVVGLTTAL